MTDFDKFNLIPQYSLLRSRKDIDTGTKFSKSLGMAIPIASSPMNTVTEKEMAEEMFRLGGIGIIHRYMTMMEQEEIIFNLKKNKINVGASISINNQEQRIKRLLVAGADVLTLDVAHGDMKQCHDLVRDIKSVSDVQIVSGNIVTESAAERYYSAGVDAFRVGIGSGSSCTTRIVAGVGYNQLMAINEIHRKFPDIPIVSDGGINNSGCAVKALAFGASSVFIGNLLAPTSKSPAERFIGDDGHRYAVYGGMASSYAETLRINRTGEKASDIIHLESPEGEVTYLKDEGEETETVVNRLVSGIKIGMAYMGSKNIGELWQKARWTEAD